MMMRNLLCGVLIGFACILPGASGGVLAVALGLYRPMLDALMHFFKAPGRHLRFLTPLAVGGLVGIVAGAVCLSGAMARHERLMLFLFTGLIVGGIPDLMHEAQQREPFRLRWLLALGVGVLVALPLCLLGSSRTAVDMLSPVQAFLAGVLEGVGTVVPGISTSLMLIQLGWYQAYLTAASAFAADQLAYIAAGFLLSAFVCMRLAQRLFERWPGYAFYGVLGFLLVSVGMVFPGFTLGLLFWAEISMLTIGVVIVRMMGQLEKHREGRK